MHTGPLRPATAGSAASRGRPGRGVPGCIAGVANEVRQYRCVQYGRFRLRPGVAAIGVSLMSVKGKAR
jgi:hypothetical protein